MDTSDDNDEPSAEISPPRPLRSNSNTQVAPFWERWGENAAADDQAEDGAGAPKLPAEVVVKSEDGGNESDHSHGGHTSGARAIGMAGRASDIIGGSGGGNSRGGGEGRGSDRGEDDGAIGSVGGAVEPGDRRQHGRGESRRRRRRFSNGSSGGGGRRGGFSSRSIRHEQRVERGKKRQVPTRVPPELPCRACNACRVLHKSTFRCRVEHLHLFAPAYNNEDQETPWCPPEGFLKWLRTWGFVLGCEVSVQAIKSKKAMWDGCRQ